VRARRRSMSGSACGSRSPSRRRAGVPRLEIGAPLAEGSKTASRESAGHGARQGLKPKRPAQALDRAAREVAPQAGGRGAADDRGVTDDAREPRRATGVTQTSALDGPPLRLAPVGSPPSFNRNVATVGATPVFQYRLVWANHKDAGRAAYQADIGRATSSSATTASGCACSPAHRSTTKTHRTTRCSRSSRPTSRRGGGGGIRTHGGASPQWFSRPSRSTAPAPRRADAP
jgi:hypothetical protein